MSGSRTMNTNRFASTSVESPRQALRLRLKPKAPITGYVDGAWWPRSRDLSAELPALLAVSGVRLGRIERVTYNLTWWQPAARRLTIDGRTIRLEGFRSQHLDTVTVIGQGGHRMTLLVVPPATNPAAAHHVLMAASHRHNLDSIETLLAPSLVTSFAESESPGGAEFMHTGTQRWETDGGLVR
jgi:hypothetical protein